MGLDCEYPNSCDCGCQDEPTHTGCKCCGRETAHSDDCLIPEIDRLRAALQKAEAEFSARLETIKKDRREWMDRCAKAEAERDEAKERARKAEVERDQQKVAIRAFIAGSEATIKQLREERDTARRIADKYMSKVEELTCQDDRHIPSGELIRLEATMNETLTELTEARRDLLAVAHAIGIVYEPDTGPCWPGPIEEIVKAIKDAKHEAREADSERARAERLEAKLSELTDGGEK